MIYSCIQGGYEGEGNIDTDPLFINGSHGDFYLSETASGQSQDSPCLNVGSDLSDNLCYDGLEGQVCLNELTTRTDEMFDFGGWGITIPVPCRL